MDAGNSNGVSVSNGSGDIEVNVGVVTTPNGTCDICSKPCDKHCVRCMQVYYCSKEHQAQGWKAHKTNCHPVKIIPHPEWSQTGAGAKAKALIAMRDIKQGEIILKEKPLLTGPRGQLDHPDLFPLCLECYRKIGGGYPCSKCSWPLCGPCCENGPKHSKLECSILAENAVEPATGVFDYISIYILRALLVTSRDPEKLKLFQELDQEVRNLPWETIYGMAIYFVQTQCRQTQFDMERIKLVAGVFHNHRMSDEDDGSNGQPAGSYLYYKTNFASHSCTPNSMWFIQSNDEVYLRASLGIKKGELVTTTCVEMEQNTPKRRKTLEVFGIDCKCKRCKDPTERGTFLSAVKCTSVHCKNNPESGYYLPQNPLDGSSVWKCTNPICTSTKLSSEIDLIVTNAEVELRRIEEQWLAEPEPTQLPSHMRRIRQEEKFLTKYENKILHKQHMILFRLKRELAFRIPQLTPYISKETERNELEIKQVGWARECLNLADKFWPGLSRFRGQLLYCLQRGMFCLIFTEVEKLNKSRRSKAYNEERLKKLREAFEELLTLRREVKTILSIEREGKSEKDLAIEMDEEGIDFQNLRHDLVI